MRYFSTTRSVLLFLLVAGLLVSAGGAMGYGAQRQFLQGTWADWLDVEGFPKLPMYCTYFPDLVGGKVEGTMLCSINRIELPTPAGKLVLQGTGHGAWVQSKSYEFDFNLTFFITNEGGQLVGMSKIKGVKHLNREMDKYTGEGIDEIEDMNGNVMATSHWTVEGEKMVVVPLEKE